MGSNPDRAIPKALKMVPVATLLGAQYYKASTGFSSPHKFRTTNNATLTKQSKSEKSLIIINVCIHRRTVWKTGNHAKYVILLKYRDYYYYYYYYCYFSGFAFCLRAWLQSFVVNWMSCSVLRENSKIITFSQKFVFKELLNQLLILMLSSLPSKLENQ